MSLYALQCSRCAHWEVSSRQRQRGGVIKTVPKEPFKREGLLAGIAQLSGQQTGNWPGAQAIAGPPAEATATTAASWNRSARHSRSQRLTYAPGARAQQPEQARQPVL